MPLGFEPGALSIRPPLPRKQNNGGTHTLYSHSCIHLHYIATQACIHITVITCMHAHYTEESIEQREREIQIDRHRQIDSGDTETDRYKRDRDRRLFSLYCSLLDR